MSRDGLKKLAGYIKKRWRGEPISDKEWKARKTGRDKQIKRQIKKSTGY